MPPSDQDRAWEVLFTSVLEASQLRPQLVALVEVYRCLLVADPQAAVVYPSSQAVQPLGAAEAFRFEVPPGATIWGQPTQSQTGEELLLAMSRWSLAKHFTVLPGT